MRFFEVKTINGQIGILSEIEIEKYREKIDEVRTEFTEKEIKDLKLTERDLTEEEIKLFGLN